MLDVVAKIFCGEKIGVTMNDNLILLNRMQSPNALIIKSHIWLTILFVQRTQHHLDRFTERLQGQTRRMNRFNRIIPSGQNLFHHWIRGIGIFRYQSIGDVQRLQTQSLLQRRGPILYVVVARKKVRFRIKTAQNRVETVGAYIALK